MSTAITNHHHEGHHDPATLTVFGFWIYIMSDCILFATLFATYAVMHTSTFGGPGPKELFSMPLVLAETFILLTSSFTYGLSLIFSYKHNKKLALFFLCFTFILGAAFVAIELTEFHLLVSEGHSWSSSAFLSSYFTLVGTHGLHVTLGLVWMLTLIIQVMQRGLTNTMKGKLFTLGLFWHFLDIVWIFIFTVVYLMGGIV